MEPWHIWVIVGVVLFIGEVFTPAFFLACVGIGCLAGGFVAMFDMGFIAQIGTFAATMLVMAVGVRPLVLEYFHREGAATNVDALVGSSGVVTEAIDPVATKGRVRVNGEDWWGVSSSDEPIPEGENVVVVKVEGTQLIVARAADAAVRSGEEV